MRGNSYEPSCFEKFDSSVDAQRFVGRILTEIEFFAHLVLGCRAEDFGAWIGRNLTVDLPEPKLKVEKVPVVPEATRSEEAAQGRAEAVVDHKPHGGKARRAAVGSASGEVKRHLTAAQKAHLRKLAKERYDNLTPRQKKIWNNKLQRGRRLKAAA